MLCNCGALGYIAISLPVEFNPGFPNHQIIDDAEGDRLRLALTRVTMLWFEDGIDEFDVIDAINEMKKNKDSDAI